MIRRNRDVLKPVGIFALIFALLGCGSSTEKPQATDPKWEEAHATALSVIELVNVKRTSADRSYYYPREVADCDSDGVYEAIVGWHPSGGPEGTDLLWRVVGDTMLMSEDSALLWHEGARLHFASGTIRSTFPLWRAGDSACCPSREVRETYKVRGNRVSIVAADTVSNQTSR